MNIEREPRESLIIRFKRLRPEAIIPAYAHGTDVGMDLFATENYSLKPQERHVFNTGLASEIPEGYFVMFKPKSGLAVKAGIDVLAGVIDSGYWGEWGVVLINLSDQPYAFKVGDKIAQAIVLKVEQPEILEVDQLSDTDRGQGGFGSTGK